MYHYGVTLLGIFPRDFSDSVDNLLSRHRTLSQSIVFGLFIPNVNPQIKCACANPKYVTSYEQFSNLNNLRAYDQYALGRFGVIPPYRYLAC